MSEPELPSLPNIKSPLMAISSDGDKYRSDDTLGRDVDELSLRLRQNNPAAHRAAAVHRAPMSRYKFERDEPYGRRQEWTNPNRRSQNASDRARDRSRDPLETRSPRPYSTSQIYFRSDVARDPGERPSRRYATYNECETHRIASWERVGDFITFLGERGEVLGHTDARYYWAPWDSRYFGSRATGPGFPLPTPHGRSERFHRADYHWPGPIQQRFSCRRS